MDIGVISVRYARALLKSATDTNIEDTVYANMQLLAKSYMEVPALRHTIDNPMLAKEKKLMLLETAVGGDSASPLTKAFIALYRKQKNVIRGKLTTAVAVAPETEQKMRHMVESRTKGIVEFETEVDPEIIGGFVLEYDTYRMDASVKSKLNSILNTLKK